MKKHILFISQNANELDFFMEVFRQCVVSFKCTYASGYEHALNILLYLDVDYLFVDESTEPGKIAAYLDYFQNTPRLQGVQKVFFSTAEKFDFQLIRPTIFRLQKNGDTGLAARELQTLFQAAEEKKYFFLNLDNSVT